MAPHVVSSTSVRAAAPASLALSAAHATRPARRLAARSAAGSASPGGAARLALSSGALPRRPRRSENASRTLVGVSSRELDELRESLAPLRSLDASADSADGLCRTHFVAETSLPTAHGVFRVRAYRHTNDGGKTWTEPVAIISGRPEHRSSVPVRVHDACFTSEVLGSCKCDCKAQLDRALETISRHPPGIVVYLHQEGRGIGLANKLAAYALQERGLDTVDANRALGLPDDCREYSAVAGMMRDMDVRSVRLMTNNPRKLREVAAAGVAVDGRLSCVAKAHPIAHRYMRTKAARMGHQLGKDEAWMGDDEDEGREEPEEPEQGTGEERGERQGEGEATTVVPLMVVEERSRGGDRALGPHGPSRSPLASSPAHVLSQASLASLASHHVHSANCACRGRGGALGPATLTDAPKGVRRAVAEVAPLPADLP